MTTAAQVSKALQPILDRHSDVALVERWLNVKPVRHVFRGVLVDRTSQRNRFEPRWSVVHLFELRSSAFFNWGSSQVPPYLLPPFRGLWEWSRPDVAPALQDVVEKDALPKLRSIDCIDDLMEHLVAYYRQHGIVDAPPLYDWPHVKLIFDVAMGKLERAQKPCKEWVPKLMGKSFFKGYAEDQAAVGRLKELSDRYHAADLHGLAKLLHEWEATTVRNLKIQHLWEPTPFPLGLGGTAPSFGR
jgi:hypothetical protein